MKAIIKVGADFSSGYLTSIEFNTKYLSDISFSSNDYVLNALLTILPNKIFVHLGNYSPDEFINTLMLIFEDKIVFPKENKKQSFLSNKK